MSKNIGGFTFLRFPARSHGWAEGMNNNAVKASALLQPAVLSRTTPLPVTASDGDCYIDPATNRICLWVAGEWYQISPRTGAWVYVKDANEYAHFNDANQWVTALDLDGPHAPIERTLAFYNPGLIRPNSLLFNYVAGMEFTIPQDAPGTGGTLEVPPSGGSVVFPIYTRSGNSGHITFGDGSTVGTVTFPNEVVVHPTEVENEYTPADHIHIRSPADLFGAEGLSLTIRGKIRAID